MCTSLSKFLIKSVVSKLYAMWFYDKITESEQLDTSIGTDVICTGMVSSKQCVTFVTSTFSKTETLTISLMFTTDIMTLPYVLNR